jgi:Protein of unknown function (DUF3224)
MTRATGTFEITSMGEDTVEERDDGGKLTRAWGDQAFSGDITGDGAVQWVSLYRGDKTARLIGLQRIAGSVGGRTGSFVIEAGADFSGASSEGTWVVVPGSGTGDLAGITGSGSFKAADGKTVSYELDYSID